RVVDGEVALRDRLGRGDQCRLERRIPAVRRRVDALSPDELVPARAGLTVVLDTEDDRVALRRPLLPAGHASADVGDIALDFQAFDPGGERGRAEDALLGPVEAPRVLTARA